MLPQLQLSHNRKALLKYLLRIIALSSYSPAGNVAATRPQDEDAQLLFASLKVGGWCGQQTRMQDASLEATSHCQAWLVLCKRLCSHYSNRVLAVGTVFNCFVFCWHACLLPAGDVQQA